MTRDTRCVIRFPALLAPRRRQGKQRACRGSVRHPDHSCINQIPKVFINESVPKKISSSSTSDRRLVQIRVVTAPWAMVTMHHKSTEICFEIKYRWRADEICATWHWGISSLSPPTVYGNTSSGMWKLNTRSKTQIIQEQKTWNSLQNSVSKQMPSLEIGISPWNVFLFWSFWCNLNSGWGNLPLVFYGDIHTQGCKKPAETPCLSPRIPHHPLIGFSIHSSNSLEGKAYTSLPGSSSHLPISLYFY